MQNHPATLGGFTGEGYALVRRHGLNRTSCDGVFSTTNPDASKRLRSPAEIAFDGMVYSGPAQQRASMAVLIHSTHTKAGRTVFHFVSRGDPLEAPDLP